MRGKRILLGITGGIAAYKITFLIRLLIKAGAEVKCIMTPAAKDFISPLVLSTLSKNPVGIEFWNKNDGSWNNHVDYALWADLLLIAPLTANSMSKMASGSCDNLLLASYLSMKSSTMVAPAMDLDMYKHPTVIRNMATLEADGISFIPAEDGELASGLAGEGRMAEPETIFNSILNYFETSSNHDFSNKMFVVTAGPTHEAIDPVRFIGNRSSGKMGYSIAKEILNRGGSVKLITGPTKLELEHPNLETIKVVSADDMLSEVQKEWEKADFGIFAAAVADYKARKVSDEKIKKNDNNLSIDLQLNPDILKWAGNNKSSRQCLVGFALESHNAKENASKKLKAKNLDAIVINTLQDSGAGFEYDTNKISILDNDNNLETFELKSKSEVAKDILNYLKKYNK